jgi:hypothetical protein
MQMTISNPGGGGTERVRDYAPRQRLAMSYGEGVHRYWIVAPMRWSNTIWRMSAHVRCRTETPGQFHLWGGGAWATSLGLTRRESWLGALELKFRACICLGIDPSQRGGQLHGRSGLQATSLLLSARPRSRLSRAAPASSESLSADMLDCCDTASGVITKWLCARGP